MAEDPPKKPPALAAIAEDLSPSEAIECGVYPGGITVVDQIFDPHLASPEGPREKVVVDPPTSEARSSTFGKLSADEIIVLVLGEGTGIPLCFAAADALINGEYLRASVGWAIGLSLAVAGASFHFWRGNMKTLVGRWARKVAPIAIPIVALLAFAYVVGPDIYRRSVIPNVVPINTNAPSWSHGLDHGLSHGSIGYRLNASQYATLVPLLKESKDRSPLILEFEFTCTDCEPLKNQLRDLLRDSGWKLQGPGYDKTMMGFQWLYHFASNPDGLTLECEDKNHLPPMGQKLATAFRAANIPFKIAAHEEIDASTCELYVASHLFSDPKFKSNWSEEP